MKVNDNGTDRDMNETELAAYETFLQNVIKEEQLLEKLAKEKQTAKQAVLDRLGITSDEAALLLG